MYDVAIIGAGPAGASAAIFTSKAGKKTLVIDNDKGVTKRAWVENHYGVMDIAGPDLVNTGKEQATKFGTEIIQDTALEIVKDGEGFQIKTEQGTYSARYIILATGFALDLAENIGVKTSAGTEPRVKAIIDVNEQGKSNIDGIWVAGTVAGVSVHTIVTAGDGAKVAINLISEINGERYVDHDVLKS